jgi:hypothetical protein
MYKLLIAKELLKLAKGILSETMPSVMEKQFTKGEVRWCFENARKEYWAQKERGKEPVYWVGYLSASYHFVWQGFAGKHEKEEILDKLLHAWVVVDNKIVDATLFKYGIGNFNELDEKLPIELFEKHKYEGFHSVPEKNLLKPLKFFPKEN